MLALNLLNGVKHIKGAVCSRNLGILAPALQKCSDPIQQMFVDKIREYKQKSSDGKLVDPSAEILKELTQELEKVAKQYGGAAGEDMTKFPSFNWTDPAVDPINQTHEKK